MEKVSIVIPIYIIDAELFKMTVDIINDIRFKTTNIEAEIIIVDDCSPNQKMVEILERKYAKDATWIHHRENKGFAHSVNIGMAYANNDLILLLNNDVHIIDSHWLSNMINTMKLNEWEMTSPNCGWLDGNLEYVPYARRKKYSGIRFEYLLGWALLLKRSVIEKIGLFPTIFGKGYWEDTLYSKVAQNSGIKMGVSPIASEGQIGHFEHSTFKKIAINLPEQYKKNRKIYMDIISGRLQCILPKIEDYTKGE